METQYQKINNSEMKVIKDAPIVVPVESTYSIDFLKQQELGILKQMNDYIATRQTELAEVRELISQAETLGLKTSEAILAESVVAEEAKLEDVIK